MIYTVNCTFTQWGDIVAIKNCLMAISISLTAISICFGAFMGAYVVKTWIDVTRSNGK